MGQRAYWKGFIKIGLVSFPVKLFTATSKGSNIQFHQLHKETHHRVKQAFKDPDLGEVSRDDLVKGYEVERGQYVVVEPSELEAIKLTSTKTIDIDRFVKESEIDECYVETPYYLAPDGPVAEESFRVVAEAMKRKKVVGIAQVVLGSRERLVKVKPRGKGVLMSTLHYAEEVNAEEPYFEEIGGDKPDKELLTLAETLIDQKLGHFDISDFTDHYAQAVQSLVKSKIAGKQFQMVAAETPEGNVVSLMDALRKSVVDAEVPKTPPAKTKRRSTGKQAR